MLRGLGGKVEGVDEGGAAFTTRFNSLVDPLTPFILLDPSALRPSSRKHECPLDFLPFLFFFMKSIELAASNCFFVCCRI